MSVVIAVLAIVIFLVILIVMAVGMQQLFYMQMLKLIVMKV